MMEFQQEDRDMLIRHDQKLGTICSDIKTMAGTLSTIDSKLDKGTIGCVENRAACRREVDATAAAISLQTEEKLGGFFTKTVLRWFFGFIIAGMIGLGVYSSETASQVLLNTHNIQDLEEK